MSEQAPDVLGEVVAYRAWRVVGSVKLPMLASVTYGTWIWHPQRWTIATCHGREVCPASKDDQAGPGVPGEHCSCGLYAARDRGHMELQSYKDFADDARPVFIGEVGLAGKVIPGTQGWRAEKGRIRKLFVPWHLNEYVDPLRSLYGVEVELSNTFSGNAAADDVDARLEQLAAQLRR